MSKFYYLTTAIDYVNGRPHLGHAYEKVITDIIARAKRSLGKPAFYLTGLDEHGQKVDQSAQKSGKQTQLYCDELAVCWKALVDKLNLDIDDFVRTTEQRHIRVVQAAINKLNEHEHFYKAEYRGYYSTKEETFLTDRDMREDGTFDPAYGEVTELVEENYYFRLSRHQDWLIDYIEKNPGFIEPQIRRNEVLGFLKNNELEDLCVSRPASRLRWGIPIPFDPEYVTYVWFDALLNYISVPAAHNDPVILEALNLSPVEGVSKKELWPADVQVIGKDILKFHTVYWPIMLKAMEIPMPRQVLVHGWWQKEGRKMSKTTGNIVDPIEVVEDWGEDAFRYYIVRELAIGPDGNWTDSGFAARYHAELANGLGNLVNRSLSMLNRYRKGVVPNVSNELAGDVTKTVEEVAGLLEENKLQPALLSIWSLITRANQYVDSTMPFKLAKDPAQGARLDEVLYNLAETCRILAVLVWPFIPRTADKIYEQLGLNSEPNKTSEAVWGGLPEGHKAGRPAPLFPRRDVKSDRSK
ncbi:MAG: methionine--tRNA ligase [Verrucomicrobia bacterium]|nr:methionine--tRNA ligase [Verrucomicrobiota bacterium]MCF7709254.1 methionine--tRNA ligase [Verrucomicrobiota bacterium]